MTLSRGIQPLFCQYAKGSCDQDITNLTPSGNFFIFSNEPATISVPIILAIEELRKIEGSYKWTSWKDLHIAGKIIFCEICKAIRMADLVIADVTTLNFNVLFEIGYAIGVGVPVLQIRDTSYIRDSHLFSELGLLDTVGYIDFQNSMDLAKKIKVNLRQQSQMFVGQDINRSQPIYAAKSITDTEGSIKILSSLKKSGLRFRTFDPKENIRLSLHEAWKQVTTSLGIITHLLDKARQTATINNARCSFISGLAMAMGKKVLMLHEEIDRYPIDYRDVIRPCTDVNNIPKILEPFFRDIIFMLQDLTPSTGDISKRRLEKIDFGDIAAENEIRLLKDYFVPTGQFQLAKQGHKRIVVGRKGSGKTAIFYRVRDSYDGRLSHLVVDLKPEGHQFSKLRETVLTKLTPGLQEHSMTAFWQYILLLEIAHKVVNNEENVAIRDNHAKELFDKVCSAYEAQFGTEQGDFSERLLKLVEDIASRYEKNPNIVKTSQVTELIYKHDIKKLYDALTDYLRIKEETWVLVDNLDKGWPVKGASSEDILILRSLLSATRKMQREWEKREIDFKSLVFIRNDIYDHLVKETADKEKDTPITLDWDDLEIFKELIINRIRASTKSSGSFDDVWMTYFDPLLASENSFVYMIERTLMRPRDILKFVQSALAVAINRNHDRVSEDDILQAESTYSEDLLQNIIYELKDIYPQYPNIIYEFLGCSEKLKYSNLIFLLEKAGVPKEKIDDIFNLLIWFGFLGINKNGEAKYSYQVHYNLFKLGIDDKSIFVIHPAFRKALECTAV